MLCKKCSFNNADNAVFCTQCGTPMKKDDSVTVVRNSISQMEREIPLQQPVNEVINTADVSAPVYPSYGSVPASTVPDRGLRIVEETKKLASSPLMIVSAAALTISTFFSFVSYFANFGYWKNFFGTMLWPFVRELENFKFDDFDSMSMFAAIIGGLFVLVATTLLEVGIWSTVAQGFSRTPHFNTSGLSSIKSAQKMFVTLAYCSIGYLLLLVVKILMHQAELAEDGYNYSDDMMGMLFSLFFILVVCAVFYIVVYTSANRSLSTCENGMKNNGSQFYASPALAIILIALALLFLICIAVPEDASLYDLHVFGFMGDDEFTLPLLFVSCFEFFKLDVFATLATFFFIVSSVGFASVIFVQRSKMSTLYYESKYSLY